VANHGRSQIARLEQVDAEAFDEMLAVNLRAPFLLARRTIPAMSEHGFGRVLFMSSVAGLTGGIVARTTPRRRPACTASRITSRAAPPARA
jgi:3-oxoacyl-[acyl-carrier protein] reductase